MDQPPATDQVPAVTVPISLIATFIVLMAMNFTVNLLTLLALVLAIGLVVDDAIVVLENIHRRMAEHRESALVAAFRGTRQVGFAVIATTLVLVAVFSPIAMLEGDMGRLFSEFALTMSAAVLFSSLVALTLCPVLASLLLSRTDNQSSTTHATSRLKQRSPERPPPSPSLPARCPSQRTPWSVGRTASRAARTPHSYALAGPASPERLPE